MKVARVRQHCRHGRSHEAIPHGVLDAVASTFSAPNALTTQSCLRRSHARASAVRASACSALHRPTPVGGATAFLGDDSEQDSAAILRRLLHVLGHVPPIRQQARPHRIGGYGGAGSQRAGSDLSGLAPIGWHSARKPLLDAHAAPGAHWLGQAPVHLDPDLVVGRRTGCHIAIPAPADRTDAGQRDGKGNAHSQRCP